MVLTNERAALFADFLKADVERANKLVELSPEEVVAIVNEEGNNFTVEEVVEFGENLKAVAAAQSGELSEDKLEEVAGGLVAAAAGVYLTCVTIGVTLGIAAGKNWKW